MSSISINVMVLSDSECCCVVNAGGADVALLKSEIITLNYETENAAVLKLPECVAIEKGMV